MSEENWKIVAKPLKKIKEFPKDYYVAKESSNSEKINEPCWFFNNGGCKNRDGTDKPETDCKYLHIISPYAKKPPLVINNVPRPCDKHNIEGYCKWGDYCKYSHRNLSQEEWVTLYPNLPFVLKTNNQKRQLLEVKIDELESRINILEYKLKSMDDYYEKTISILKGNIGEFS